MAILSSKRGRLALLGVVLVLLGGLGWHRSSRTRTDWQLPDGTRIHYAGFTYGTNHASPLRHFWEHWPLPAWLSRRLPREGWAAEWPALGPELRLWFRLERVSIPETACRWDLVDESGLSVAVGSDLRLFATNGATGLCVNYGAFPRRGRTLRLTGQCYDRTEHRYRQVLELALPNPRPLPADSAETAVPALPLTARDGALEFTLTAFETGLDRYSGYTSFAARPGSQPSARLDFLAASNGVPNRDWFPLNVRITDTDGHLLNSHPSDWLQLRNVWALKVEPAPWAGQPWRLRVEFSRNNEFAPEELVTFRGLRVQGQSRVAVDQQGPVGNREVALRFLRYENPRTWEWRADARLVRREPGVSLTLVEARDERDRKLWRHPRHLAFRPWPDSESVNLTFAVHASRFVEFVAAPVDVRPPASPPRPPL